MKAFLLLMITAVAATTLTACNKLPPKQVGNQNFQAADNAPPRPQSETTDIKASFTIVTNGLTRNFSAKMYHNLSPDVYIESPDPSTVHVKKTGITWNDFFKSLPMQLTKECLITGTKETFCRGENGTLRFYINDIEDKDLLDKEIKEGDKVLIQF